jgi:hypothetical protein
MPNLTLWLRDWARDLSVNSISEVQVPLSIDLLSCLKVRLTLTSPIKKVLLALSGLGWE